MLLVSTGCSSQFRRACAEKAFLQVMVGAALPPRNIETAAPSALGPVTESIKGVKALTG
jgi:hypothetical protein